MSSVSVKSRAFGLNIEEVDIVVVDDNPGMIKILMTILSAFKVKRARYYTSAEQALTEMIAEPPHIVVTDWLMKPIDGLDMLQTMRNKAMHPLCNTATIVLTGEPSRKNMASAVDNGATFFMVKPISPSVLMERLKWVCSDNRDYVFNGDQMMIKGQKTQIRPERQEKTLPEPMLLDFVSAAKEGVEPVLRKVTDNLFAHDAHEDSAVDEFVLDDEEEELGLEPQKDINTDFKKQHSEDDEDCDWLNSNFAWAL